MVEAALREVDWRRFADFLVGGLDILVGGVSPLRHLRADLRRQQAHLAEVQLLAATYELGYLT